MHEQDGPTTLKQRLINPGAGAILGGLLLGALVARVGGRGGGGVKAAYVACCGVCVLMVCWVLVFPGSCYATASPAAHKRFLVQGKVERFVPLSLLTKYGPHLDVCLAHQLPAALWCAAIPFQLHPMSRVKYRRAHRFVGRIWFAISALLMYGVYLIDHKGLHYHITDFPGLRHEEATSLVLPEHVPRLDAVVCYFLFTGVLALWGAATRRVAFHRSWTLRHVAAGLWVGVQRVIILVLHSGGRLLGYHMLKPQIQKAVFGDSAYLAVVLAIATAEVAIADLSRHLKTE